MDSKPVDPEAPFNASTATPSSQSTASLIEITTDADFAHHTSNLPAETLAVVYFHAPWANPCKQMSTILSTLASTYPTTTPPSIVFLSLNAEELPDISEAYDVTAVPYIVLQKDGKNVDTISGSDPAKVRDTIEKHAGKSGNPGKFGLPPAQSVTKPDAPASTNGHGPKNLSSYAPAPSDPATAPEYTAGAQETKATKEELHQRLTELVKASPVMLFMKGTPSAPQCGFSRQTVALLRERAVRYGFFNILADDEVRQGLKEFADWPTFPQLWVDGELVGGLDIVKEEFENNEEFLMDYAVNKKAGVAA
ncbi:hydroperoxide and superoxide-radical responsive glutathione-dependent oxidoreductase [Aulographum hederae CBS 113979]|uniref:Hydroperoxide and superoxide-radical responsive glutathione-dependent oxidoreductase n=1 Tax=Aulographum hederae CBS 113979 TaxID=1176131 RepID=A0A6G1GZ96_9PEZI|nr:hydroperoxide and superoxide-radical responsive glutathione-dependent oxidoreductase [Aulographum hederae CBS 113979]